MGSLLQPALGAGPQSGSLRLSVVSAGSGQEGDEHHSGRHSQWGPWVAPGHLAGGRSKHGSGQVCCQELWSPGHFCGLEAAVGHQTGDGQSLGGSASSIAGSLLGPLCHSGDAYWVRAWLSAPAAHRTVPYPPELVTPGPLHSGGATWVSECLNAPQVTLKSTHYGSQISYA